MPKHPHKDKFTLKGRWKKSGQPVELTYVRPTYYESLKGDKFLREMIQTFYNEGRQVMCGHVPVPIDPIDPLAVYLFCAQYLDIDECDNPPKMTPELEDYYLLASYRLRKGKWVRRLPERSLS